VSPSRFVRATAPLVIAALALSACGSTGSKSSGKKTYAIAYQGPLSGDNAQLGINMDNAVKLAVQQANAKGNLPFNLKFIDSDDAGDPAQSPAAAQKLIDDGSVVAVVGPAFSGATNAAEPHFSDVSLISVSPSATRADLTSNGFTSFVRVVTGDNVQGAKMADFVAKGLKAKSAYVIDDKSAYGAGITKFVKQQLSTDGVSVNGEGIPPTKDYSAVATKAVASGADTVVYGGYYAEFALLTKALRTAGFKGSIISGDGSKDDQYIAQGGAATEGAYFTCPCGGPVSSSPVAQAFEKDYKAAYKGAAGTYSAESFDAANLIIAAMKSLGSDITRAKLSAAVKATSGFVGITHTVTFDAKGEGGTGDIFAFQVKAGKIVLLGKITDGIAK